MFERHVVTAVFMFIMILIVMRSVKIQTREELCCNAVLLLSADALFVGGYFEHIEIILVAWGVILGNLCSLVVHISFSSDYAQSMWLSNSDQGSEKS